jgi:hypothetical protein
MGSYVSSYIYAKTPENQVDASGNPITTPVKDASGNSIEQKVPEIALPPPPPEPDTGITDEKEKKEEFVPGTPTIPIPQSDDETEKINKVLSGDELKLSTSPEIDSIIQNKTKNQKKKNKKKY